MLSGCLSLCRLLFAGKKFIPRTHLRTCVSTHHYAHASKCLQNMCSYHLYVRPAQLLLEAGLLVPTPPPKPDIRSPKSNTDQDSGYGRYGESPRSSELGSRLEGYK